MTAFDVAPDGTLNNRTAWARFGGPPASRELSEVVAAIEMGPDGMSELDAEGAIWVADAFHRRALRVREGGEVVEAVTADEGQIYDVTLGGADGRTLFVATSLTFPVRAEQNQTRDSVLRATRVDVPLATSKRN